MTTPQHCPNCGAATLVGRGESAWCVDCDEQMAVAPGAKFSAMTCCLAALAFAVVWLAAWALS